MADGFIGDEYIKQISLRDKAKAKASSVAGYVKDAVVQKMQEHKERRDIYRQEYNRTYNEGLKEKARVDARLKMGLPVKKKYIKARENGKNGDARRERLNRALNNIGPALMGEKSQEKREDIRFL